jgi:hypothetical protein
MNKLREAHNIIEPDDLFKEKKRKKKKKSSHHSRR